MERQGIALLGKGHVERSILTMQFERNLCLLDRKLRLCLESNNGKCQKDAKHIEDDALQHKGYLGIKGTLRDIKGQYLDFGPSWRGVHS